MPPLIINSKGTKRICSEGYNTVFDKKTGFFARWGKSKEEDPETCPFGAEIADVEIATACNGVNGKVCKFCYKANTQKGEYMPLALFRSVFRFLNGTGCLSQIALGLDSQAKTNPDTAAIMSFCRQNDVVPNLTVAQIDDETADMIAHFAGACAVSRYDEKDACYDSVKKLTERGMEQVNIHCMASVESFERCLGTLDDIKNDPRLADLNAIVFLSLKKKGRGANFTPLSQDQFNQIVDKAMKMKINFGFDSCSGPKFMNFLSGKENEKKLAQMVEPCESGLFSIYCDVRGNLFPCSFCPGTEKWNKGVPFNACSTFKDFWFHPRISEWRKELLGKCRACPIYQI